MAFYYAWRGDLVYGIYQRMGGSRSRAEVSELFDQETDILDYKYMVGGWMEKLLEEEGEAGAAAAEERAEPQRRRARGKRAPLPHETAEVLGKSEARVEDPLAELEKVKKHPPAKKVSQKPKKKPSLAPGAGTNQCVGRSPWPCIYNLQRPGARGRYDSSGDTRQRRQCLICDSARLAKACGNSKGRSHVLSSLKKFRAVYEEKPHIYNSALLRLPDACRDELHEKAAGEPRPRAVVRQERRAQPSTTSARTAKTSWAAALASRKRAWRRLTAADLKKHKKQVKADRKRVQKKFFEAHDIAAPAAEDIADNDAGLPAPALSEQGRFVELWAKFGSWGICKDCRSLQPRRLEPIDCRRVAKPEIAPRACKACQNGKDPHPQF